MKKRILFLLMTLLLCSCMANATTLDNSTIELNNETIQVLKVQQSYNDKNYLFGLYLTGTFLFWMFILSKTPQGKFDQRQLLRSLTVYTTKAICWLWFIAVFYSFKAIIFISKSDTFLDDKLYIFGVMTFVSVIAFSIIGVLNLIKWFYHSSSMEEFVRELWGEIKYEK